MPPLTEAQTVALRTRRAADMLGDLDIVATLALGGVLADQMAAEGYRQNEDAYGTVSAFRLRDGASAERAPHRGVFLPAVCVYAIAALTSLSSGQDRAAAARARATLQILTRHDRGAEAWLRATATRTRDSLPSITDDELADFDRTQAEARRATRAANAQGRDLERERVGAQARRTADKDTAEADTLDLLAKWLPTLPPGSHLLGDVWAAFERARNSPAARLRLRETKPGALRIGRTAFYKLLPSLGTVSHGIRRSRYFSIPDPSTAATKKETAVNLAEAVLARTVEILATATAHEYRDAVAAEIRELSAAGRPAAALLVQRGALSATASLGGDELAARRARRTA